MNLFTEYSVFRFMKDGWLYLFKTFIVHFIDICKGMLTNGNQAVILAIMHFMFILYAYIEFWLSCNSIIVVFSFYVSFKHFIFLVL